MKTINIHGKEYVEVSERVKEFHKLYPDGMITTKIISNISGVAVMKATVTPDVSKPERFFTGHAYENESSGHINKTSYIENCETSATGRCLGLLGIGIIDGIASADEVANAIAQQNASKATTSHAKPVAKGQDTTTHESGAYWRSEWNDKTFLWTKVGTHFSEEYLLSNGFKQGKKTPTNYYAPYTAELEQDLMETYKAVEAMIAQQGMVQEHFEGGAE